jgi:hypothetical protein
MVICSPFTTQSWPQAWLCSPPTPHAMGSPCTQKAGLAASPPNYQWDVHAGVARDRMVLLWHM